MKKEETVFELIIKLTNEHGHLVPIEFIEKEAGISIEELEGVLWNLAKEERLIRPSRDCVKISNIENEMV